MTVNIEEIPCFQSIFSSTIDVDNIRLRNQCHRAVGLKLNNHPFKVSRVRGRAGSGIQGWISKSRDRISGGNRSKIHHDFRRCEGVIGSCYPYNGGAIHHKPKVFSSDRMKYLSHPSIHGKEISGCHIGRVIQLEIEGVSFS